ncbi:unnamed protein product, partial [Prorocentrum cordatum]
ELIDYCGDWGRYWDCHIQEWVARGCYLGALEIQEWIAIEFGGGSDIFLGRILTSG